ncbi:hypothetical protein H101_04992 [Trichophyton interdigitale H6]|nr:hypothetical protein H101_04992 [Trichophyton interdigitale H6]
MGIPDSIIRAWTHQSGLIPRFQSLILSDIIMEVSDGVKEIERDSLQIDGCDNMFNGTHLALGCSFSPMFIGKVCYALDCIRGHAHGHSGLGSTRRILSIHSYDRVFE